MEVRGVSEQQKLRLSAEPDGFGFYYGSVWRGDEHLRVDVLPPECAWPRGAVKLDDHKPDAKAWIVFFLFR